MSWLLSNKWKKKKHRRHQSKRSLRRIKCEEMKGVQSPLFRFFSFPKHLPTLSSMASLSRSFASSIVNRSYVNAPASSSAVKRVFHAFSSSEEEHKESHSSQPLFTSATKQRSAGGLVNKTTVNGIYTKEKNSWFKINWHFFFYD